MGVLSWATAPTLQSSLYMQSPASAQTSLPWSWDAYGRGCADTANADMAEPPDGGSAGRKRAEGKVMGRIPDTQESSCWNLFNPSHCQVMSEPPLTRDSIKHAILKREMGFTEPLFRIPLVDLSWPLERAAAVVHIISVPPIKYLKEDREGRDRGEFTEELLHCMRKGKDSSHTDKPEFSFHSLTTHAWCTRNT